MDLALLKETRRAFLASFDEDMRIQHADVFLSGSDSCKGVWIHGLDCESTLAAGGVVFTVETADAEDIAFTVMVNPITGDLMIEKSVNTVDRNAAFRALEAFCEAAIKRWVGTACDIVVVEGP